MSPAPPGGQARVTPSWSSSAGPGRSRHPTRDRAHAQAEPSIRFPLDALVAVAKRLSRHESEAGMDSEDFYLRYARGEMDDDARSIDWANDYRHFLALCEDLKG